MPRGGKELLQTLGVAPQPLLLGLQAGQVSLVLAQLTSRGFQFPLKGQILVLAQLALVKRLLYLLLGRFQRVQLFAGLLHGVRQQLLLLLHQHRVLWVKLQELGHIGQRLLGVTQRAVDPFQGIL